MSFSKRRAPVTGGTFGALAEIHQDPAGVQIEEERDEDAKAELQEAVSDEGSACQRDIRGRASG